MPIYYSIINTLFQGGKFSFLLSLKIAEKKECFKEKMMQITKKAQMSPFL